MWKEYDARGVKGILVRGDLNAPKLRRWNYLWLVNFRWKRACVLKVNTRELYGIGYISPDGIARVYYKRFVSSLTQFNKPILLFCRRREDCKVFAFNSAGKEVRLTPIKDDVDRNDSAYQGQRFV